MIVYVIYKDTPSYEYPTAPSQEILCVTADEQKAKDYVTRQNKAFGYCGPGYDTAYGPSFEYEAMKLF